MKPIPTIKELNTAIESDFKNQLEIDNLQSKMVINATTAVLSAQLKMLYLFVSDRFNNMFPDTADISENGGELNRLGFIYLNRQPKPATNGYYTARVTGVVDSKLRNNLTFKSNEDSKSPGKLFIIEDDYFLTGVDDIIQIRSLEAGGDSVLEIGDELTITEPVIGVQRTIEVEGVISLPLAGETIEEYRKKIIDAIQLEPQGGAKTDYRLWSQDAQGVRNVYPYVKENSAGTVQVFVEANALDSIDSYGTPSQTLIDLVDSVIKMDPDDTKPLNERGRIPIQSILEVLPITLRPVDITIIGLQEVNLEIKQLLRNNIYLFLQEIRPFIDGADLLRNKNDILYSGKVQSIVSDSLGGGNFFSDLKTFVDGQEIQNFKFSLSNIPYLRDVNYQ